VLVVSADPAVRSDWARYFVAQGLRILRCVGPQVLCVLIDGGRQCPLHEEADLAIYDRATLTPQLTRKLIRVSHSLPIAFAKDQIDAHGHHEPVVTAVASMGAAEARAGTSARGKAAGFAGLIDKPFLVNAFFATLKHAVEAPPAAAPPDGTSLAADAIALSPAAGGRAAAEWDPVDFFNTAVHELRTPLTSVLGQAQLALRYVERDPARARAAIARTIEQASRMNRLIGELLDPARVTVGALSLAVVSFDLGNTIAIAIPQYEHGDLPRISFEVPSEPVQVRGDPDRIAQVVGNLLDNALKYSPAGSPIAVSLAIVGNEAYVRVEDMGVGIAAEEGERIFAPFYRAARTRDVPGTGLGLHISRRLAEQHRGRLWLEKSTDLGSVFTLALPLAQSVPLVPGSEHEAEHEALASQLARLETVADAIGGERLPLETLRTELDRAYDLLAEKVLPHIRKADDLQRDLVRHDYAHVVARPDHDETERLTSKLGGLRARMTRGETEGAPRDIRRILYELHAVTRPHFADERQKKRRSHAEV